MQQRIRVVVVDDSALMRSMLIRLLEETGKVKVIDTATNGVEGVEKICSLQPDVATMDVEMPRLDGISALKQVMRRCQVPVIMLSTLTGSGTQATMRALSAGAVDFVAKPSNPSELSSVVQQLTEKISVAVKASAVKKINKKPVTPPKPKKVPRPASRNAPGHVEVVVVGASTGGPAALQALLPSLPGDFPAAVVVVQHLPKGFSGSMAEHLNRKCSMEVMHAAHNEVIKKGKIYVAPAGYDFEFKQSGNSVTIQLDEGLDRPLAPGQFRPSVDGVMTSAAGVYGSRALGVLLTGMGRDGAKGMELLKKAGAFTVAEDESTCVVFGMPKAAIDIGAADTVITLPEIGEEIVKRV